MKLLTRDQAEALVVDQGSNCTRFDPDRFRAFLSVWETRRIEAIDIYRRQDLAQQAEMVIAFVEAAGHQNLGLVIARWPQSMITSFLFNFQTRDHLDMGGTKVPTSFREENRSL
jgi:hypothetical protein